MYMHKNKIAILIPARKGSKRLNNKNLKIFLGKPLLQWTIESALRSKVDNIFFTTNYLPKEIGFTMPKEVTWINRPGELCQDNSYANDYIRHFFGLYPNMEIVILLQVTSPLRVTSDIESALKKYLASKSETLISAFKLDSKNKLYRSTGGAMFGTNYRMSDDPIYYRNSAIYIFSQRHFNREGSLFSSRPLVYEMPLARSIDIDTQQDFNYAERMVKYNSGGNIDVYDNIIVNNSDFSMHDLAKLTVNEKNEGI